MSKSSYELLEEIKNKQLKAIEEQEKNEKLQKEKREKEAKKQLDSYSRGVYNSYLSAINPYGSMMEDVDPQGKGTSDYLKNAAYGEYLKGLSKAHSDYSDDMEESNSLWQQYLTEKSKAEAEIEYDYNKELIDLKEKEAKAASGGSSSKSSTKTYTTAEMHQKYRVFNPISGKVTFVTGKKAADRFKELGYTVTKAETLFG